MRRKLRGYLLLHRISESPWEFFRTCFLNRWLNPLRYHMCDECHRIGMRKHVLLGAVRVLFHRKWRCAKCSYYQAHHHDRADYIRWLNGGF